MDTTNEAATDQATTEPSISAYFPPATGTSISASSAHASFGFHKEFKLFHMQIRSRSLPVGSHCTASRHRLLETVLPLVDSTDMKRSCSTACWDIPTICGMNIRNMGLREATKAVVRAYQPDTFLEFRCGRRAIRFHFHVEVVEKPESMHATLAERREAWNNAVVAQMPESDEFIRLGQTSVFKVSIYTGDDPQNKPNWVVSADPWAHETESNEKPGNVQKPFLLVGIGGNKKDDSESTEVDIDEGTEVDMGESTEVDIDESTEVDMDEGREMDMGEDQCEEDGEAKEGLEDIHEGEDTDNDTDDGESRPLLMPTKTEDGPPHNPDDFPNVSGPQGIRPATVKRVMAAGLRWIAHAGTGKSDRAVPAPERHPTAAHSGPRPT